MPVSSSDATPKRRWFTPRLRTLLLLAPLAVLGLGQLGNSLGLADKEVHVFLDGTPRPTRKCNGAPFRLIYSEILRSDYVITTALDRPGIRSLPALQNKSDPAKWVGDNLQITVRNGEAELILRGADEDSLQQIADALVHTYVETWEIADRQQHEERMANFREYRDKMKNDLEEITKKLEVWEHRLAICEHVVIRNEIKKEIKSLSGEERAIRKVYLAYEKELAEPMKTYPIDVARPSEVVSGWELLLGQE